MKVQGKFKMQAHIMSSVVMDVAAFKVSHSIGIDIDTTALRAARARSSSIHSQAPSIGAMDESAGKDQDVNTHSKSRCCRGCCSLQS